MTIYLALLHWHCARAHPDELLDEHELLAEYFTLALLFPLQEAQA